MGHLIGIPVLPRLSVNRRCHKGPDIMAAAQDIFSGIDAQFHAVLPHLAAGGTGVDLGVDGNGGKHGVKRTRRGVGHKGIVEYLVVAVPRLVVDVIILFMDLRSLRKTGLLFMDRLDDEDTRIVVMQVEEKGRAVLEHGNELFIADPGRIKEDVVAEMADAVDDVTGVVQRAVIGVELDDGQTEGPFGFCLFGISFGCSLRRYPSSKQWSSMPPMKP